jgi:hypothetical protein
METFAAVALLIDRHEQPWSPFVATWSPALESLVVPHAIGGDMNSAG